MIFGGVLEMILVPLSISWH